MLVFVARTTGSHLDTHSFIFVLVGSLNGAWLGEPLPSPQSPEDSGLFSLEDAVSNAFSGQQHSSLTTGPELP